MLYILWAISFFSTIYYAAQYSNSRSYKKLSLAIVFIFMWILLGWASGAYDVNIGISRYINYKHFQSYTEVGFNALILLGHGLGMSYRTFFVLCSFFELIVLFWFVDKNCPKAPIVLAMFLVYPLTIYFQYTRNILAFAFVLIALDSLINRKSKYQIKYVVLIIIASTIHFSSIYFLAYLPLSYIKKPIAVIITSIAFVLLYLSQGIQIFSNLLSELVGSDKTDIVLRTTVAPTGTFGRVFAIVFAILVFFIVYYLLKYGYRVNMTDYKAELIFKINCLSFVIIPLSLNFGVGFARLATLLLIVNYVFFVDRISQISRQRTRLIIYLIIMFFLLGLWVLHFRNAEYRELVLYPFFNNNELFNYFFR